jgi:hypothetical protein
MERFIRNLVRKLVAADVRFVVVGGVAVVLHGYARLTVDLDLIVELEEESLLKCVDVLESAGLRPKVPVSARELADASKRQLWIDEKNMRVFAMTDPADPRRTVDLFVEYPVDFEELWRNSVVLDLGDFNLRIASIEHLIAMKKMASRPKDLDDIEKLEVIAKERKHE